MSSRRWWRDTSYVWVTGPCRMCAKRDALLRHDEVHELARDDDRPPHLAAVQQSLDARRRERLLDDLVLRQVDRQLQPVAYLPVHLDDQLVRLPLQQGGVGLRPGL